MGLGVALNNLQTVNLSMPTFVWILNPDDGVDVRIRLLNDLGQVMDLDGRIVEVNLEKNVFFGQFYFFSSPRNGNVRPANRITKADTHKKRGVEATATSKLPNYSDRPIYLRPRWSMDLGGKGKCFSSSYSR
jgi:hypothetical protein